MAQKKPHHGQKELKLGKTQTLDSRYRRVEYLGSIGKEEKKH